MQPGRNWAAIRVAAHIAFETISAIFSGGICAVVPVTLIAAAAVPSDRMGTATQRMPSSSSSSSTEYPQLRIRAHSAMKAVCEEIVFFVNLLKLYFSNSDAKSSWD